MRVIGHHTDRGGRSGVVELLDWVGDAVPRPEEVAWAGVLEGREESWPEYLSRLMPARQSQMMIGQISTREFPAERVTRMNTKLPAEQTPEGFVLAFWRSLDKQLEYTWGLR